MAGILDKAPLADSAETFPPGPGSSCNVKADGSVPSCTDTLVHSEFTPDCHKSEECPQLKGNILIFHHQQVFISEGWMCLATILTDFGLLRYLCSGLHTAMPFYRSSDLGIINKSAETSQRAIGARRKRRNRKVSVRLISDGGF